MIRALKTVLGTLTLVGFTLWLLAGRDFAYLIRVIRHGDSGTADYTWKHSLVVPATNPEPWVESSRCLDIDEAFENLDGRSLDAWLTNGGAFSFVVVRNGALNCEWHRPGRTSQDIAALNSISKVVTSLLLARAIEAGSITSIDDPITKYVPELSKKDKRFDRITLANLVDMRSGIRFSEETKFPWVNQDPPSVYYASDLAGTAISRSTIMTSPGAFQYNDYSPNLIGIALERSGFGNAAEGSTEKLWAELRAQNNALWSVDDLEFPWHESGFVAAATDVAKIGQLLLDDGQVGGQQVAPVAFVKRSLAAADQGPATVFGPVTVGYGNGWWTLPRNDGKHADLVAMGRHGQVMLVSPATNTVIVRLGEDGHPETNIAIATRLQAFADRLE
jgi:CubicO group peptidase (beta-lactamase class C family)